MASRSYFVVLGGALVVVIAAVGGAAMLFGSGGGGGDADGNPGEPMTTTSPTTAQTTTSDPNSGTTTQETTTTVDAPQNVNNVAGVSEGRLVDFDALVRGHTKRVARQGYTSQYVSQHAGEFRRVTLTANVGAGGAPVSVHRERATNPDKPIITDRWRDSDGGWEREAFDSGVFLNWEFSPTRPVSPPETDPALTAIRPLVHIGEYTFERYSLEADSDGRVVLTASTADEDAVTEEIGADVTITNYSGEVYVDGTAAVTRVVVNATIEEAGTTRTVGHEYRLVDRESAGPDAPEWLLSEQSRDVSISVSEAVNGAALSLTNGGSESIEANSLIWVKTVDKITRVRVTEPIEAGETVYLSDLQRGDPTVTRGPPQDTSNKLADGGYLIHIVSPEGALVAEEQFRLDSDE